LHSQAIRSHFNFVFVVVRAVSTAAADATVKFAVHSIHYKNLDGAPLAAFGPTLPSELDASSAQHRRMFVSMLVNAERAVYRHARMNTMSARTQRAVLNDLVQQFK
jgi:hypothetical protein